MEQTDISDCLIGKIDFAKTNSFTKFFLDYISGKKELQGFHNGLPTAENLLSQIDKRNFNNTNRTVLANVLEEQFEGLEVSELTAANIKSLKENNTYTITTGHQLNIFTGPLYVIYKIVSIIRACEELKELRPDCNFVPVYWMASEDHDFEEISYFRYNERKFVWDTDQTGAVGRFDPKSIAPIFDEIIGIPDFFRKAYLKQKNLAGAVRFYMNALFGEYGLVTLDADDSRLKALFTDVIEADILDNIPEKEATSTSAQLDDLGYKTQVFPRPINFFYLKENIRSRIEKQGDIYQVLDSDIQFTEAQLKEEIQNYPDRFSPNVILRPLYQEYLLPNLAYVGGPSELVYWLQLKGIFDHFNQTFPLLMPRAFAGVITTNTARKIEKLGLTWEEVFMPDNDLVTNKVKEASTYVLDLEVQKRELKSIFNATFEQAKKVDTTLEKTVLAEHRRGENSLEKLEKKLLRAERKNQEVLINRIYAVKDALFPGGSPQERKDNFLNFYLADNKFIDSCMEAIDPFDYRFHLLSTNE